MIGGSGIKPISISTAGIHPLVKKSVMPRIKQAKAFTAAKRGAAMSQAFGPKRGNMSRAELHSTRLEMGRKPRG